METKEIKKHEILSTQIKVFLALALLMVFLAINLIGYFFTYTSLINEDQTVLIKDNLNLQQNIDGFFGESSIAVKVLAKSPSIIDILDASETREDVINDSTFEYTTRLLSNTKEIDDNLINIWYADISANITVYSNGTITPQELTIKDRSWYKESLEAEDIFFTEPLLGSVSNSVIISIVSKVYNYNGELIGFVGASVPRTALESLINNYGFSFDATNSIISKQGNVVLMTDEQGNPMKAQSFAKISDEYKRLWDVIEDTSSGLEKFVSNNENYYLVYSTLDVSGWIIGNTVSEKTLNSRADLVKLVAFVIFSLNMIILILLLWASRSIYREGREFQKTSKMYEYTQANLPYFSCFLDKEYKIINSSNIFAEGFNKNAEDIVGVSFFDLTQDQAAKDMVRSWLNRLDDGEKSININTIADPNTGSAYHVMIIPMIFEDKIDGYAMFYIDVSEEMRLNQILEEQMSEIMHYADSKDNFVANVSHEIRTPINAINGMIYFLKKTKMSKEQITYISKLENATDLLLSLVNDILDLSKINSNKIDFLNLTFPINNISNAVTDMFKERIEEKGVTFNSYTEFNDEYFVKSDELKITQVAGNFASNAFKFTENGEISVKLTKEFETDDEVRIHFLIKDTGIGIKEDEHYKVWEEFEQIEGALNKRYQGTGLGLTICKNIIEQLGGEIYLESHEEEGSTFGFKITLKKGFEEDGEILYSDDTDTLNYSKYNVLIVEDNEINAEIAIALVEEIGCKCLHAENGQIAVDICEEKGNGYFNLIFMDIHMPVMNGYEASEKIKFNLKHNTPIVALTATIVDNEDKILYPYIDDYIPKPFKIEMIKEAIIKYCRK